MPVAQAPALSSSPQSCPPVSCLRLSPSTCRLPYSAFRLLTFPAVSTTLPVIDNRRARFDYHILETYETGIVLKGTEIKSIRMGKMSLAESFVQTRNGELFLVGAHIDEYAKGNQFNHVPRRERKLLAHAREIRELEEASSRQGHTLIPLKAYFKGGKLKVLVGVGKGKATRDKRDDKMKQEAKIEMARALRARNR